MPPKILGVFTKRPEPGRVKTRLASETSPNFAARVAEAMLLDTLDRFGQTADQRVLAYTPSDAHGYFRAHAPSGWNCEPQSEGDLGQRMRHFFHARFQEMGSNACVVLIGSDSPMLPVEFTQTAFQELESVPVVLGPTEDGGYYALGCTGGVPDIFAGVSWSTPAVLRQTQERLGFHGVSFRLLPEWFDVDTLDDWRRLKLRLRAFRQAGRDAGAPRTEQLEDLP